MRRFSAFHTIVINRSFVLEGVRGLFVRGCCGDFAQNLLTLLIVPRLSRINQNVTVARAVERVLRRYLAASDI